MRSHIFAGAVLGALAVSSFLSPASATLHGFCYGNSTCSDNNTNTPTSTNPPQFGFTSSAGPATGDFRIDLLIPNNEVTTPSSLKFTFGGTQGGTSNNAVISATTTLVSSTAWTSGDLASYLGISASPTNPIGGFLTATDALDSGATGFYVYQADLGSTQLQKNSASGSGPLLSISPSVPVASYLVGFLYQGTSQGKGSDKKNTDDNTPSYDATSNSGAIFVTGQSTTVITTTSVPEPASIAMFGMGLLGVGLVRRRRAK